MSDIVDTLEQIDVTHNLINQYDDFQLATTADQAMEAIKTGKIASLLGVEGYVLITISSLLNSPGTSILDSHYTVELPPGIHHLCTLPSTDCQMTTDN